MKMTWTEFRALADAVSFLEGKNDKDVAAMFQHNFNRRKHYLARIAL